MKTPFDIEQHVSQTLNSLEGIKPAEAGEFLFARIKRKMAVARHSDTGLHTPLMLRLAVVLILFMMINVAGVLITGRYPISAANRASGINALNSEYFSSTGNYNY